jgi:hypothetical protein
MTFAIWRWLFSSARRIFEARRLPVRRRALLFAVRCLTVERGQNAGTGARTDTHGCGASIATFLFEYQKENKSRPHIFGDAERGKNMGSAELRKKRKKENRKKENSEHNPKK